jgi:tRNA(Ile)-lysidine synthase
LAGVLLRHWRGRAVLCREAARLGPPVRPGEIWDRRWKIETPPIPGQIRALGADGLRHLPDWRSLDLPRAVLIATPALWQGDALIAAPLAGHSQGVTATITAPFSLFLLSH